ncbi:MAG TPA: MFS transporter [Byssovorax sp.]
MSDLAEIAPAEAATAVPSDAAGGRAQHLPWVVSTYFAEGLPYAIVRLVSQQFFTFAGGGVAAVGLTSLYGLAWDAKFAWSPLVDRFGTTKRWVVATEVALGLLVLAIAVPAAAADTTMVARMFVAIAIVAATHDVAIDGFYLAALGPADRAAFTGVRVAAYRAALFVGAGALVALAGVTSWGACFGVGGVILLGFALVHARLLPRAARAPVIGVGARAAASTFGRAFASFATQPGARLAIPFILCFRLGDALMFAMGAPFLKSLGFQALGSGALGGLGVLASIGGAMLGGAALAQVRLSRALFPIAALQGAAILFYAGLAATHDPPLALIGGVIVAEQFIAGLGNAALLVFLMHRCRGDHKAAHFACGTALMSIPVTMAGPVSAFIVKRLGFTDLFLLAFAASLPGVVISRFVKADPAP